MERIFQLSNDPGGVVHTRVHVNHYSPPGVKKSCSALKLWQPKGAKWCAVMAASAAASAVLTGANAVLPGANPGNPTELSGQEKAAKRFEIPALETQFVDL